MNWIIHVNIKTYDVTSTFAENRYVDWRQSTKFDIGDRLFY